MKQCTIVLALVITFVACGKSKTQSKKEIEDELLHDYYQKHLRYDGLSGKVDSAISKVYEAEGLSCGELVSKDIKRFNTAGYIISHETWAYDGDQLHSAGQTLYTRDKKSLESEQINSFITQSGAGYTLQYSLVDRGSNKETWELLRKIPGRDLELFAEIREYTKNGMQIYAQVGNSDSVVLKYEYTYLDNGLDSSIFFYDEGVVRQAINKTYNEKYFPIALTTQYRNRLGDVEYEKTETYEYSYDELQNPIEIRIFDDNILMGIIKNEFFYRKENIDANNE